MLEDISYYKIKAGTERNFGLVFAAVFVIISLYPLWFGKNIHLWACIIAFIFFFFAIFLLGKFSDNFKLLKVLT